MSNVIGHSLEISEMRKLIAMSPTTINSQEKEIHIEIVISYDRVVSQTLHYQYKSQPAKLLIRLVRL